MMTAIAVFTLAIIALAIAVGIVLVIDREETP